MQAKDSTGKFNGNPHEFGKVRNKIITGLRVANGFDIAMGTEIPPAPPAELANNPSAAERTAHNGATDRFVKQQADFQRRTGLAFGAITDHICDDILGAFEKTEGDPAKAYKLFLSFGPAEDSATDEIYWFNALMSLKMTHSDFFDAFISRFDVAKEKSKTRDAPSTELLRKAMPERLATEVKHTSMSKMDYAATKAFLRTEDSTWHAKNSGPMENSKKESERPSTRLARQRRPRRARTMRIPTLASQKSQSSYLTLCASIATTTATMRATARRSTVASAALLAIARTSARRSAPRREES